MKKICVVTGTRAEYGLLKPLIRKIQNDGGCELQLAVTGMHLSPEFGLTYQEVEKDGFHITDRNEMLLSSDTPNGITKSIGLGVIGFADIFTRSAPNMVVLLGDRSETFAAAVAAMIHRIPIAHIHGGELTEGAVDDALRHSITKMSILHFTSTEQYKKRIIQMGENPDRVFCTGALGVENIRNQPLLNKEELAESIHFSLEKPYFLVTYHPVTLENNTSKEQFQNLLSALSRQNGYKIIFTKSNADTDGRIINQMIDQYVNLNKKNAVSFTSMGMQRYLSALKYCEIVVGNSSSGIIEAPSLHVPAVNIGNRQKGRIKAESVIDCGWKAKDVEDAIRAAVKMKGSRKLQKIQNPYEKSGTSELIFKEMKHFLNNDIRMEKSFYNMSLDEKQYAREG